MTKVDVPCLTNEPHTKFPETFFSAIEFKKHKKNIKKHKFSQSFFFRLCFGYYFKHTVFFVVVAAMLHL